MLILLKFYSLEQVTPGSLLDHWFSLLTHMYSAPGPFMHCSQDTVQNPNKALSDQPLFKKNDSLLVTF